MSSRRPLLVLSLFLLPILSWSGCSDRCLRNSDCAAGQSCVQGVCITPPDLTPAQPQPSPDLATPADLALSDGP